MSPLDELQEVTDGQVVAVGGFAITAMVLGGTDDASWRAALCGWMDARRSAWGDRLRWAFDDRRERWRRVARFPSVTDWVKEQPLDMGFEFHLHSGEHREDAAAWSLGALAEHRWQGASGFVRVEMPASWVTEVGADQAAAEAMGLWRATRPTHGWASFSVHRPMEGGLPGSTAAGRWVQEHGGLQLDEPISLLSMRPGRQVLAGSWLTYLDGALAEQCPGLASSPGPLQIDDVGDGVVLRAGTKPRLDVEPGSPTHQALVAAARALAPIRMMEDPSWYPPGDGRLAGPRMTAWLRRFDD